MLTRTLLVAAWLLCFDAVCHAAPPSIADIRPRGVERGKAVEVVVTGANLTPAAQLWLGFPATVKPLPEAKPNPAQAKFLVTADAKVPVGVYPARIYGEDGVTNLTHFAVDAFPEAAETEPNDTLDKAQKVAFPVIVNGQCAGGDVDFFRFALKKGQRVVVESVAARAGSGVAPHIRVTDAKGRFVVSDDSQKLRGDARAWFIAAEDGDFAVEFSDTNYRGDNPAFYRLKIADYDFADEIFPLGGKKGEATTFTFRGGVLAGEIKHMQPAGAPLTLPRTLRPGMIAPEIAAGDYPEIIAAPGKDPQATPLPATINGRFLAKGETHRFQIAVKPESKLRLSIEAETLGSALDALIKITDQKGKQLATADDGDIPPVAVGQPSTKTADPALEFTVPKDISTIIVEVRDALHRGGVNFGYRLTLEPAEPDFLVRQLAPELNIPRGGLALVTVPVTRRGYAKPIQLGISGLPAGWTLEGGYIPEGANSGHFTIKHANPALPVPPGTAWKIEARGALDKSPIRFGEQRIVLSKEGSVAACSLRLEQFAVGLAGADPFTLQGPATLEVVHGYPTPLPIAVAWTPAKDVKPSAVEVNAIAPQEAGKPVAIAATVKPATAAVGAAKVDLSVTAPVTLPEGRIADLALQGKAKVNNKDVTVIGPAIQVTVKRPFKLEIATPKLTLVPGQTIALKGKIQRHAVFKEAVNLKLDGLPAGVAPAAPILPLAADKSDFQIDLKVDAKATIAPVNLTLTATTTISGMAYTHPPAMIAAVADAKK